MRVNLPTRSFAQTREAGAFECIQRAERKLPHGRTCACKPEEEIWYE
jgi:hypothetical protein